MSNFDYVAAVAINAIAAGRCTAATSNVCGRVDVDAATATSCFPYNPNR